MSAHYETVRDFRSHRFHLFMTLITCGLWSPVLLLAWVKGRRVLVPCPTCSWPGPRETVGLVCQTCGTDYGR